MYQPPEGVEVRRQMVLQDCLDDLFARLLMRPRDMLKCIIRWSKDGVVGLCAVEKLHKVFKLVDDLDQFRRELAAGD